MRALFERDQFLKDFLLAGGCSNTWLAVPHRLDKHCILSIMSDLNVLLVGLFG